jgi:predicted ribosome quality control (RQC) complex YloA/Tae2 family protein
LDRLFLRELVSEIGPRILRRRIRGAEADRRGGTVRLSLDRSRSLVWSFLPEAAGLYLGEPPARSGGAVASPGLKRFVGAIVTGLEIAELDRIVTLSLAQTKLSGRTSRGRLVLEILATRVDLYLVDVDSGQEAIVEVFCSSRSRLGPGERYRPPSPPPGSSPLAADGDELERRLDEARRAGKETGRSLLLAATGFTPLLVREMEWLMGREGCTVRDAFERVSERLSEKRPLLYASKDPAGTRGRLLLVSPLPLESERELVALPLPQRASFSSVMEEAVALALRTRRIRSSRARVAGAVSKRLARARGLRRKLLDDEASFEEPEELRLRGEKLLAGLARARRSPDGRTVSLPDLFDPEEREMVLEIDPRLPLPANAERFFARAKKATRAHAELSKRLAAVDEEISYLESLECDVADAVEAAEIEELEEEAREEGLLPPEPARNESKSKAKSKVRSSPRARLPPREFLSHRGRAILVGRSARSNEETTFQIAAPRDLWLHAAGVPGAHVVLRLASGAEADEQEIEEAAGLAAYFSKRRNDTAVDVLLTECRHVARIKGAPRGLVKVSSAKTVRAVPRLLPERKPDAR